MNQLTKLRTFFDGIVMGIAEIVPGVSASTATLLLGIYDDFINLLASVTDFLNMLLQFLLRKTDKDSLVKSFRKIKIFYGIQLFLGMAFGIVLFSNLVDYLYSGYEGYIKAVFFGIILASLIIPFKVVRKPGLYDLLFFVIGFTLFYTVLHIGQVADSENMPLWLVFAGGAISVTGMVLPGVNSSFLLIPLGIYELILNLISEFSKFNFTGKLIYQAIAFAVGLAVGVITIVRLLKWAFAKHITKLFSLIAGIMIASLSGIWPYTDLQDNFSPLLTTLLILISTVSTFLFIKISKPEKELL